MADTITNNSATTTPPANARTGLVVIAWLVVIIPAAWGITQTVRQSAKLFQQTATSPTTAPSAR